MKENFQEIYINLDDSGKLSDKELVCVYGGIVFFSKSEKDKFITQYRKIINEIKCGYCSSNKNSCDNSCPEIKNINIKPKDKRRIMNYMKRYFVVTSIIKNSCVYNHIMNNKASKGRYIDFTLKILIKEIVVKAINLKIIDPNKPLRLIVNIDQQATKNNGYYNLYDGIIEELLHGIQNFNYNMTFKPVLNSKLELRLSYQDSLKSYVVQAADLLAGTIRKISLDSIDDKNNMEQLDEIVDLKVIFP